MPRFRRVQDLHQILRETEMVEKDKVVTKPAKTAAHVAELTKKQIAEAVEKTKGKAEEYARDPEKTKSLLRDALNKAKGFEKNRGPLAEVWSYLTALFRLLKAYVSGKYREIPLSPIVLVVVAILYFVSTIDAVPDVLPGGLLDDAAVIGFVVTQIKVDLDNFLAWEIAQT